MRRTVTAQRTLHVALEAVRSVLLESKGQQVIPVVVEAPGGGSVGQRVRLEVMPPSVGPGAACWPVRWAPETKRALLPSFEGVLLAQAEGLDTRLVLTGWYQPPLGPFGVVFDAAVGRRVAQRSIDRFVDRLAQHLAADIQQRADTAPWHPWPAAPDMNPHRVRA